MRKRAMLPAWGRVLRGYRPFLSIEITKECPLRCPGCYAYEPEHLNNGLTIRQLTDLRGQQLVDGVLSLVRRLRPLHVSIVGGEPLVRHRELSLLLPKLDAMGVEVQLVTSAVRPIPAGWAALGNLHVAVSIDGLQPEHDARRAPATYERVLRHIEGHRVVVHCTVTRQMLARADYFHEFARFWSDRVSVRQIWFSLFTPQEGEFTAERLTAEDRRDAIERLAALRPIFPKAYVPEVILAGYRQPPRSPSECFFAQITDCVSPDLTTRVTPCQFGGTPVCAECGCMASAGLASIGNFRLAGLVSVGAILQTSRRVGDRVAAARA